MLSSKDHTQNHSVFFAVLFPISMIGALLIGSTFMGQNGFILFFFFELVSFFVILSFVESALEIGDNSLFLAMMIFISAFQNLYVGYFVNNISTINIKILMSITFTYPGVYLIIVAVRYKFLLNVKFVRSNVLIAITLASYSILTAIIFEPYFVAALSSFRNIISPTLFLLLGLFSSRFANIEKFKKYILIIGVSVIAFGIFERFFFDNFEEFFNLKDLFYKKGLYSDFTFRAPLASWFSSEKFAGYHVRRMVSSFAEPVNLGTFLYLIFVVSFLNNNKILMVLSTCAIGLAVSKGGLMSLIIFTNNYVYYKAKRFYSVFFLMLFVLVIGLYHAIEGNSTGSMSVHIKGLLNALIHLPKQPLGTGLGSVGVISSIFSIRLISSDIKESGLGLIIGQLGIVGFITYGIFFALNFRAVLGLDDVRVKIALLSLLTGIMANIMFNEVALSPNSCAGYFLLLGLYLGRKGSAENEN